MSTLKEYRIIRVTPIYGNPDVERFSGTLNALALQGWRLVAVTPDDGGDLAYLERDLPEQEYEVKENMTATSYY